MPGTTATDWLDSLNWGTSTGGAAGSAETTSTLGTDRTDYRVPPDTYTVGGLQITRVKNLVLAMSQYLKGGTRLQVLTQTSTPFGATEHGFWCDASGNPRFNYNGTAYYLSTDDDASGVTLPEAYANGTTGPQDITLDATRLGVRFNAYSGQTAPIIQIGQDDVGTAQTVSALNIYNSTVATSGAQKFSPMAVFGGNGWKTNATAASQSVRGAIQFRPVQGAAAPTGEFVFWTSINAGAFSEQFKIGSGGTFGFSQNGTNFLNITNGSFASIIAPAGVDLLLAARSNQDDIRLTSGQISLNPNGNTMFLVKPSSVETQTSLTATLGTSSKVWTAGYFQHVVGGGTAPTIAAGAAAGSSPTVAITSGSTDAAGRVEVLTGTSATTGVLATITFNAAFGVAPIVSITPGNAATAALAVAVDPFVSSSTTTTFVITVGGALADATQYYWYFHAIG